MLAFVSPTPQPEKKSANERSSSAKKGRKARESQFAKMGVRGNNPALLKALYDYVRQNINQVAANAPVLSKHRLCGIKDLLRRTENLNVMGLKPLREHINRKVGMPLACWAHETIRVIRFNDSPNNGLAEAKNGAVVRKHMGYTHIAAPHAAAIGDFFREHLNPYLNFHRPCGVPELIVNAKGKEKRVYRWYATPWEILRQLPDVASHLKAEWTIAQLDQQAQAKSDTQAAAEMQEAKRKLFAGFPKETAAGSVAPPVGRPRENRGAPTIKNQNTL